MNQGSNSREHLRWYSHSDGTSHAEFANCVFNWMEYGSNYQGGSRWIFRNNVVINSNTFSEMGYRKYDTNTHHGNIVYGYYILPRVQQGVQSLSTGNLNF